jgi:hypothetical protein
MEQYIPKDALVAELKKRRDKNARNKLNLAAAFEDNYLLSFLDTLEVKEVDLDLGSPDGDMGVKTVWDGDKIVSTKVQKGE